MREALKDAADRLATVSLQPRLEAEWIAAHVVGLSRGAFMLQLDQLRAGPDFFTLVDRRVAGEPLAYILGSAEFFGLDFAVGPGVLIPREDTETLIEAAKDHFSDRAPKAILDLGTGSGALLLTALHIWPEAHGLGVDVSERALEYAERNALDLNLGERVRFKTGDWFNGTQGQFDLILSNPPYIAPGDNEVEQGVRDYEPDGALFSGVDGLDAMRDLANGLATCLSANGVAIIEIGWKQREAASALFLEQGFVVSCRQDGAGRDRALVVKRTPSV